MSDAVLGAADEGWPAIAAAAPGSASFAAAIGADPADMAPRHLIDLVVITEKLISFLQAEQFTAIAELSRPGRCASTETLMELLRHEAGRAADGGVDRDPAVVAAMLEELGRDLAAAEVSAALHQSGLGAARRVDVALELHDELPATLEALRSGHIDLARARTIADRTRLLEPEDRRRVEAAVLALAGTRTPGQLNPMIDRRVIAIDPDAANERHIRARLERSVEHSPGTDGMGVIRAILTADGALDVYDLLDQLASSSRGTDDRPATARRADALTDLCLQLLTTGYVDVTAILADMREVDEPTAITDPAQPEPADDTKDQPADDTEPETADNTEPEPADDAEADPTDRADVDARGQVGVDHAADADICPTEESDSLPQAPDTTVHQDIQTHTAEDMPGLAADMPGGATPGEPVRRKHPLVVRHHGRRAHLNVTMTAQTLAGFDRDPAFLAGHGAITAELAAAITKSLAAVTVVVVDGQGQATAVGATTYLPRRATTEPVITAAVTCRFPGCRRPAERCDLDHREPFDHQDPDRGGPTTPCNLDPLCRHHHRLKTHTGWAAVRDLDDGLTMRWVSPSGRRYLQHPHEHAMPDAERLAVQRFDAGTDR